MNFDAILALILKGIEIGSKIAPVALEAYPRIKADIEAAILNFTGKTTLTDGERAQLDADLASLSARLHKPLSPE